MNTKPPFRHAVSGAVFRFSAIQGGIHVFIFLLFLNSAAAREAKDTAGGPSGPPSDHLVVSGDIRQSQSCLLVEALGAVEIQKPGQTVWTPLRQGQLFSIPCRLRTSKGSRAGIQFSDKSIIRLAPNTWIDIIEPSPRKTGSFKLIKGRLFFFNRERPGTIDFSTPLATGAIRGTEFNLVVDESANVDEVILIDGNIEMELGNGAVGMEPGQILIIHPDGSYRIEAVDRPEFAIQWVLYYPLVLDPSEIELALSPDEQILLQSSLETAGLGDLRKAREQIPSDFAARSAAGMAWEAGLNLSAGRAEQALEEILSSGYGRNEFFMVLEEMVSAVNFLPLSRLDPVPTASGYLSRSYILQSQSRLYDALEAAERSVSVSPEFGAAWIRVAELSLMLNRWDDCKSALAEASRLSPRHPLLHTIRGFFLLAFSDLQSAEQAFSDAIELDNSVGHAWLGYAICAFRGGQEAIGRQRMQVAVALEPQRSLFRSYLAKSYAETGENEAAAKEFQRAFTIDPADPTPHHYASLWHLRNNDIVQSISELEKAVELNGNQSIFRSRLQLDRDESVRSADLASVYRLAGLPLPGFRRASRSIQRSYTEYASHLFAAQSYRAFEDPYDFNLRYESMRQSEWFIANLLAPDAGINLSQAVVEQRSLNFLSHDPWNGLVSTSWRDNGDWLITASAFGSGQRLSYAVDQSWRSISGFDSNEEAERNSLNLRIKYLLSPQDSFYFELGHDRRHGGDPVNRSMPSAKDNSYKYTERQFPIFIAGYTRFWNENHTTLMTAGYIQDDLMTSTEDLRPLFLAGSAGQFNSVSTLPLTSGRLRSDYDLLSSEIQHIWSIPELTAISGLRYQSGNSRTDESLSRVLTGNLLNNIGNYDFSRITAYLYGLWSPVDRLTLTLGSSFESISYPYNADILPLSGDIRSRESATPKIGLNYDVSSSIQLRGFYSEYATGLYFDNSFSIQPTQIAGFNQAYRSLIPESVAGLIPASDIRSFGGGLDYTSPSRNVFSGIEMVFSNSQAMRGVGALTNSSPLPIPDSPLTLDQNVDFRENTLTAYLHYLTGKYWTLGTQYSIIDSRLKSRFPMLADSLRGLDSIQSTEDSLLFRGEFSIHFNHPDGWFGRWSTGWDRQINGNPASDESFWRHNFFLGYRFPARSLEIMAGIENISDESPEFSVMNYPRNFSPRRTVTLQAVFSF